MPQLNLVLHGTWGIENNPEDIRLVTVDDPHHVIKAGSREAPEWDLRSKKDYRLEGVRKGPPDNFKPEQNATVSRQDVPANWPVRHKPEKVQVVITLDYPREIHSVRRLALNGKPFFKTPLPRTRDELSVVQVLVYDFDDIKTLALPPSKWTPKVHTDFPDVVNLHLFAEPDQEKVKHIDENKHFVEVFERLADAFGLQMTPLAMVDTPPRLEHDIRGLNAEDTISLFERTSRAAVSPANCAMVVLNNRR